MNKTLQFINDNYLDDIKGHSYLNKSKFSHLRKGQLIKAIDRSNLKMEINGTINTFPKETYDFIRVYNLITRKYAIIYPESYYIFVKNKETKKDKFKKSVMDFINKVEKNKLKN
jgi:hypothetical protein